MSDAIDMAVARQSERRPDSTAVVLAGDSLSYGALDVGANCMARLLIDAGCRPGDRVALILPKSPMAVLAMFGVLRAGCVCVPVDTAGPAARAMRIIEAARPKVLLVSEVAAELCRAMRCASAPVGNARLGWVSRDAVPNDWAGEAFTLDDSTGLPETGPTGDRRADDPAQILFTSGSTGAPKGVVVTHGSIAAFAAWACEYFAMAPGERNSGHAPFYFDLSSLDIFATFASGGELHLVPPELNLLPHKLVDFILDSALTQWHSVPSVLNYIAATDALRQGDLPALKRVMWCGEVLPTSTLMHWMKRLPGVQFTNLYGPTEATVASSYYTVPTCPKSADVDIPIGRPCRGEDMHVLDRDLQPVPPGELGEICISGVGLSPGYWEDPEQTAAAFVDRADGARLYRTGDMGMIGPDGLIYFRGRRDSQIKSRGYRIELGEIEAALMAVAEIREGVVVAIESAGFEGAAICCAYVPRNRDGVTPMKLRKALAERLPAYMLPARWATLDALPRNANGKIDRGALRDRFAAGPAGSTEDRKLEDAECPGS